MNQTFSPNAIRPNPPLRKPSSSPAALSFTSSPLPGLPLLPRPASLPAGTAVSPINRNTSGLLGLAPPGFSVYPCNFCGQKGNFRCVRCKKMAYCSVNCQTEDWKAHRHMCKPLNPESPKEKPKESSSFQAKGDQVSLTELKPTHSPSPQKVYLKDLGVTKIPKGTDVQASVVEFYSPDRFFILAQIPGVPETLENISTELQQTYSRQSGTPYLPCVGEIVAVQFSFDLNWYRGFVQTLAADQKMAKILYIDFGNEEDVPVDRMRPLAANIKPFCPCAMECRIVGVVPVTGQWSAECCIAVRRLLAGKTLTVQLIETPENKPSLAVDILLSPGKQLSTFLLEQGYAQQETVKAEPSDMKTSLISDEKDDNTWAQPPEMLTLAAGDQLSAMVTHFQSPSELSMQTLENAGLVQDLQLKLREHCSQTASPVNFRPAPGTVCCAQFSEDKQWYRVKVLAYSSDAQLRVNYLDFGNSEEVDLSQLRPISPSLLALPVQAVSCGLAGVQPVGDSWSEDCLLALNQWVSNRIMGLEIQEMQKGKAFVTMIDKASDPQANVAEMLITVGYAAHAPVTDATCPQAEKMTAELCADPPGCEPLVLSTIELPSDGQSVALLSTFIESPAAFYCQINNSTDHQKLMELGAQLQHHCESDAAPFVPTVGEPCCALFPSDGAWYRAIVKELFQDKVVVCFVDIGNNLTVEKSNLRSITPKLLTLPFQTVRCWLTGVEPLGSEWSSEALLWFHSLVVGEQVSARVISVTEQGYGLELESRGLSVAASLISEKLAKAPGDPAIDTNIKVGPMSKEQEGERENEQRQLQIQAINQTEASCKDTTGKQTAVPSEDIFFTVDWKTVELPLNETFQPCIVAAISPSLYYLLHPTQEPEKVEKVMTELAAHCSNYQGTLCTTIKNRPAPGAACCAQFSADNNWYRAVVLEVGEKEMSVIYADYGNSEMVPFSKILPIPTHLLELPFQIARCTLTGKEHFPADWPEEVLPMFQTELVNGVLATVQSFDGSANILSLTLPTERGGGNLTAMILDTLHAHSKSNASFDTTKKRDESGGNVSVSIPAAPDCHHPDSEPGPRSELGNVPGPIDGTQPTAQTLLQNKNISAESINGPQASSCCCQSLKKQEAGNPLTGRGRTVSWVSFWWRITGAMVLNAELMSTNRILAWLNTSRSKDH
ncbi:tudor domain-containing protein 1 [Cololabis saira]|uniref:tudor domain-containing protein 1 n=1 Tax=Cololabis saira TaxID=129043 RepID=UPI002AD41B68|nr:tudor domain-containing protein 1 [Cololabis saira]